MPNDRWSCCACGLANAREAAACVACACPASATATAIAAIDAQHDLAAFDVLVRPLLLLLTRWWPGRRLAER